MAKRLNRVVVIDIEAACWRRGKEPADSVGEIIEIGITEIDLVQQELMPRRSILVKPVRDEISQFCTELTTITQEMLNEDGIAFEVAVDILKKEYKVKEKTWASWGDYDRRHFYRICDRFNVSYPFGPTHINVKNLFALMHGLDKEISVMEAITVAGKHFDGTLHRGHDDAHNIAQLFMGILRLEQPLA